MIHLSICNSLTGDQIDNWLRLADYLICNEVKIQYSDHAGPEFYILEVCEWSEHSDMTDIVVEFLGFNTAPNCPFFDWVSSPWWEHVDNTSRGAGLRIKYMIEYGIPDDLYQQITGLKELCYVKGEQNVKHRVKKYWTRQYRKLQHWKL